MAAIPMQLTIITLNIWGIPYMSPDRNVRIPAIAEELASGKYDIVSLQEVWTEHDSQLIQRKTKQVLPYAHYFYSGVMGAGLLVLSKFPIVSSLFHAWPINGYFHRIQHADWFGGKGLGLCRIRIDRSTFVHLYNAHLHAEYNVKNDEYKTHRVLQAFDAAQFIEATRSDSIVQILAGDLNVNPDDISYKILLHMSGMNDACTLNCAQTFQNKDNHYTNKKSQMKDVGTRIDHIFLRTVTTSKLLNYTLPLPSKIPNQLISYSDHEAVSISLQLNRSQKGLIDKRTQELEDVFNTNSQLSILSENKRQEQIGLLEKAITLCDQHLKQLKYDRIVYYSTALMLLITSLLLAQHTLTIDYKILCILLNLFIISLIIFCMFMAMFWNFMERHATLSGRTSMQVKLNGLILPD